MHVSMQENASWVVITRVCKCAGQEPEQVMHAYNRAAALAEDGAPPRKLVREIYHIVRLYPDMSSFLVIIFQSERIFKISENVWDSGLLSVQKYLLLKKVHLFPFQIVLMPLPLLW